VRGKRVRSPCVRPLVPLTILLLPLTLVPTLLAGQEPLAGRWDRAGLTHDAVRYDISLSLPAVDSSISVAITTEWRRVGARPLRLDLDSGFTIRRAAVNGAVVRWRREGRRIVIPIDAKAGATFQTEIEYDGIPRDGLIIRGGQPARTIFADNWPDRARSWLAVQDHPADKAAVTWRIAAPDGYTLVANGRLEGIDSLPGARRRWRFRNDEPIPTYTMVVGMARFAITVMPAASCAVRCVPVSVYTYPEDSAAAVNGPFRRVSEMVDFFATRIAPFPYAELRHVQSSTRFGGMENSTAIFYDQRAIHEGRMSESTVAHETAHQWFGDAVTEADWHHVWLSEGFATYGAALWAEQVGGDTGLRRAMTRARERVLASDATKRPILDSTVTDRMKLLNSNSYQKGSWVLHSLRGLIGDSTFFRGIRRFYRAYTHRAALSSDFVRVMSAESGSNLEWYFRQALTRPGYPILEATATLDGGHLSIAVRQTQPPAWGVFRIPNLMVRVGDRTLTVNLSAREARVVTHWSGSTAPAVEIDPAGWWLFQVRGER
jgi:aminopeptidase N